MTKESQMSDQMTRAISDVLENWFGEPIENMEEPARYKKFLLEPLVKAALAAQSAAPVGEAVQWHGAVSVRHDENGRATHRPRDATGDLLDRGVAAPPPSTPQVREEPVAWTNEAQLEYLRDRNWSEVPMAMWAKPIGAADIPLYRAALAKPGDS